MHIFQPKTPTELKKFRKVEMKKQIVNWLITNGSIDTTERELYENAIDSLKILIVPVVYAVFGDGFYKSGLLHFVLSLRLRLYENLADDITPKQNFNAQFFLSY